MNLIQQIIYFKGTYLKKQLLILVLSWVILICLDAHKREYEEVLSLKWFCGFSTANVICFLTLIDEEEYYKFCIDNNWDPVACRYIN